MTTSRYSWRNRIVTCANGVVLCVAALPLVWMTGILAFAVRARIYLGHWPGPSRPDPKFLPFDLHSSILWAGVPVILAALFLLPPILIGLRLRLRIGVRKHSIFLILIGWGAMISLMAVPGIDFVWWFLD